MVNKFIISAGKYAVKKIGNTAINKTMENIFDTYDYVTDRIGTGSKPLNIGEEDSLRCYKAMPYDKTGFCKAVGDKARYNYSHPWKFKRK